MNKDGGILLFQKKKTFGRIHNFEIETVNKCRNEFLHKPRDL